MRLQEACVRFNKLAGIRFEELFSQNDMNMIIINKGKTGQLLELAPDCRQNGFRGYTLKPFCCNISNYENHLSIK